MKAINLVSASIALALCASSVSAQVVNDNGRPASRTIAPLTGIAVPPNTVLACPNAGALVTQFSGTNTQSGRIFRDAIASTCPSKVYPGIFNAGTTYNYESFTYDNTSGAAACVTVNFDPDAGATPCGTNAHASAYIGTYNPANQATNYVGDVGSSVAQPFSFSVPAASSMVLVVTNTSAAAVCTFAFTVNNLPCSVAAPPVPAPVNSPWAIILMGLVLAGIGGLVISRRG